MAKLGVGTLASSPLVLLRKALVVGLVLLRMALVVGLWLPCSSARVGEEMTAVRSCVSTMLASGDSAWVKDLRNSMGSGMLTEDADECRVLEALEG